MLASDGERDATVRHLRSAHLAGRLDADEFEVRVARAHAATSRAELEALREDLPAGDAELTTTAGSPRVPGRRHFEVRRLAEGSTDEVRERILIALARHSFNPHHTTDDTFELVSRRELGSRITVRLHEAPGGTLVHAHGRAPLAVRRTLAGLS